MRMTDSLPGSIVFDPFMGNQATLQAAIKLGHSFHGFEVDNKRIKKYEALLKKYKDTGEF
jgi:DNA modification methylase